MDAAGRGAQHLRVPQGDNHHPLAHRHLRPERRVSSVRGELPKSRKRGAGVRRVPGHGFGDDHHTSPPSRGGAGYQADRGQPVVPVPGMGHDRPAVRAPGRHGHGRIRHVLPGVGEATEGPESHHPHRDQLCRGRDPGVGVRGPGELGALQKHVLQRADGPLPGGRGCDGAGVRVLCHCGRHGVLHARVAANEETRGKNRGPVGRGDTEGVTDHHEEGRTAGGVHVHLVRTAHRHRHHQGRRDKERSTGSARCLRLYHSQAHADLRLLVPVLHDPKDHAYAQQPPTAPRWSARHGVQHTDIDRAPRRRRKQSRVSHCWGVIGASSSLYVCYIA